MKKILAFAAFAFVSVSALGLAANPAAAQSGSCDASVASLKASGLTGEALDGAISKLATKIVGDAQAGALSAGAASSCVAVLAQMATTPEIVTALNGIVASLNSGDVLPPVAASRS